MPKINIPGITVKRTILDGGSGYTATHYASTTGTATWIDASNSSTPCSIDTAIDNANPIVASIYVQFAPGVYEAAGIDHNDPYWHFAYSGSATFEVVFFAENPAIKNIGAGSSVLSQLKNTTNIGCIIGAHATGRSYITVDGFDFPEYQNSEADGAYQMVWYFSSNIKVLQCTFDGENLATGSQNHGFIFTEDTNNIDITDCIFKNNGGHDENAAAIMLYRTTFMNLTSSLFDDCSTGLFIKGEGIGPTMNGNLVVEKNRFINNGYSGIVIGAHQTEAGASEAGRSYIQQNIFYNNDRGINGKNYGAWFSYISLLNNTGYSSSGTVAGNDDNWMGFSQFPTPGNTGNISKDNLFSEIGAPFLGFDGVEPTALTPWDIDYNFYHNQDYLFYGGTNVTSLATWQTTYNHDENSVVGINPDFSSIVSSSVDFLKLNTGSDALTASQISGPVGCYITGNETIGPNYA